MSEIADGLRSRLGQAAALVPTEAVPDDAVRAGAAADSALRSVTNDLGYARRFFTEKAHRILPWEPRPSKAAVAAAADSLVERRLITL